MLSGFIETMQSASATYFHVLIAILRWAAPIIVGLLLLRCIWPLLTFRREPEIWAWLCMSDGTRIPVTHWENVIGRSKRSDIVIDFPTVSRSHGVLTRYDDGSWSITSTNATKRIQVNGQDVDIYPLQPEDVISIGGVELTLLPISRKQELKLAQLRTKASSVLYSVCNLLLLTLFQFFCCLAFVLGGTPESARAVLIGFGGIVACQWLLFLFYVCIRRASFEVETIAFLLTTVGMAAIASVVPDEALKQLIAMVMGVVLFLSIGWALRDLERAKKIRFVAGVAGILFLVVTLLFGKEHYGAKNWLEIGSMSVQPSEFTKVCFVFIGASAMDRLMKMRNLIYFIAYSVILCGCLALMNDFGTALIFFCAFLLVAYMRSGNILATVALAVTAVAFACVVVLKIAPHALQRFSTWRHIWDDPLNKGYQQTRALMCMASGGLLGLGPGQGWMKNVFAADSDMVIATIAEEWGLIFLLLLIAGVVALGIFAMRSAAVGRSSFYTIGACTAAAIMLVQVILNALGTVDVLPLTGVTFPFLSNGGSSMICSWGLLAFIKAADTRQNASFAVRLLKRGGKEEDE